MRNKLLQTKSGKSRLPNKSRQSLVELLVTKLHSKIPKSPKYNYLHVSKFFTEKNAKIIWSEGATYNAGRNKAKRALRTGKPRKHWQVLAK